MQLSKTMTTTENLLINFYEAGISPIHCAKLILATTKDEDIEKVIGSCAIDARNLHNLFFNEEHGNYADAVLERIIARV